MSAAPRLVRFSLVTALLAFGAASGACGSSASSDSGPSGVGPGGPLDGGAGGDGAGGEGGSSVDGASGEPGTCSTDKSPGTHSVVCEGYSTQITVPKSCPGKGCGLVIDLHGALMDGDVEDSHTELRARAGGAGYVVVQPTASQRSFGGFTGPQWFNSDDDAIHRLVVALVRDLGIDASRVHATGFSQGGYAVLRQMCKYADTYASVAAGAAGVDGCPLDASVIAGCSFAGTDKPSRAMDVLFLYGRKDAVVPPSCATQARDAIVKGFSMGAPTTVADGGDYARKKWTGSGVTLETLEHDWLTPASGSLALNKGHCIPGSKAATGTAWDDLACAGTNAFTWGTEVVTFFVAHPKK